MKLIHSLTALFTTCAFFLFADNQTRNVRVLIEENSKEALLDVRGPYYVRNPANQAKVSSGLFGKRFMIRSTQNGFRWGGEFPGVHQASIIPRSPNTKTLLNGIQYEGVIHIYKAKKNRLNIVNEVSVESYLKSTLSNAFSFPHENEVMASVAIAARTTTYHFVDKNRSRLWDVRADRNNYSGKAVILPHSFVTQCVDNTKDLIMVHAMHGRHKPFIACWTDHSAGKTAAYNAVFRKDGFAPTQGVEAPHAALDRDKSTWNFTLSRHDLAKALNLSDHVLSVETYVDPASGKSYAFRFKDKEGEKNIDFFSLQKALGKDQLPSNDLNISLQGNEVTFKGYGKGHGVGLCLFTANAMAQNGEMAVSILNKFFPNTYLVNLSATSISENSK